MQTSRGIPDEEMFLSKPSPSGGDSPTVEPLRIFKPKSPVPSSRTSSASQDKPAFPLPPGASSSAAPLPFPDDDDIRRPTPPKPYGSAYNDMSPRIDTSPIEKKPGLAERRGAPPKIIHSPTSPDSDHGLFARPLNGQPRPAATNASYPSHQQTYYPPPGAGSTASTAAPQTQRVEHLSSADPGVNRFPSTASTSTTKASRGSPPPPETPIVEPGVQPGSGIEARYAASGISGTATLTALQAQQAQSAAASQRLAQYGNQRPPQRPWTPTETPDQAPSGPPTVYQGSNPVSESQQDAGGGPPPVEMPATNVSAQNQPALQVSVLEQDFQRMNTSSPPPAYSSVNPGGNSSYPNEKRRPQQNGPAVANPVAQQQQQQQQNQPQPQQQQAVASATNASVDPKKQSSAANAALQHPGHPAFANDPRPQASAQAAQAVSPPNIGAGPASPPPLPEGWIAHLDQNSGQYYYIHLATQATQWEFPKGPNPISHEQAPLSPTASTYGNPLLSPVFGKQPMASPMFAPHTPGYAESIMSVAASQTPSALGFSGPPPTAGVEMYSVQPTNGVYFGPYLRYANMDLEKGIWHGSILIVTEAPQPPTIHIHLSVDLSPNPRQLIPHAIYTHQKWSFYKYDVDLQMGEGGTERWTYAVTSHLGCTRYEFVVAGRHETGWRFIAHSGNDFAASTSQNDRAKLGGVGFMWKDVLQKNVDCGGFHVQLGLGDQIYGDRLWKEVPLLKQWLAMSGRENKKNVQWTARHEEDVSHAYFHYYTSHFDQPFLREAFAQIPHVLQIDDHDM